MVAKPVGPYCRVCLATELPRLVKACRCAKSKRLAVYKERYEAFEDEVRHQRRNLTDVGQMSIMCRQQTLIGLLC